MADDIEQQPIERKRIGRRAWVRSAALVGGGLIAGGRLAGTITAQAADEGTSGSPAHSHEDGDRRDGPGDPSQPQRADEELLTGDTPEQVTDAALAEYPDPTIERVETDSEGVYEAHIVTEDGERLTVQVDEDFTVTGTQEHGR